jgi:transposase-like protein
MKKKNRRNFTAEFKARVALEAARGLKTINEIAAEHDLHPVQVGQWKKDLLEGAAAVFERGGVVKKDEEAAERERARLERKIGQLTMEVEWLAKKSKELGL